ncbi:transposase [Clostridium sporogenes]
MKEYILESIDGDAINYGYIKMIHHLRHEHELILNHKKVYRLCKQLDVLNNQRVKNPKIKRTISANSSITGSKQLWKIDIKYRYTEEKINFST